MQVRLRLFVHCRRESQETSIEQDRRLRSEAEQRMAEKFGNNADMEVNELLVSDVERVIISGGRRNGVEEAHAEDRLEAE